MQPAGQCETHWLGQLMAGGCLPQPEGTVWPLDLKQGALGSGNSHHSALLEARQPGKYRAFALEKGPFSLKRVSLFLLLSQVFFKENCPLPSGFEGCQVHGGHRLAASPRSLQVTPLPPLSSASSSSMDPAKGAPSQPGPREGLGLRPKRSWGASEESTCPSCKRTHSGALERP
ncbi:uncharacterized protein C16orf90 homolog [Megaptera novaeangliae]